MRTREEEKSKYIKYIRVTEDDFKELNKLNKYVVKNFNEGLPIKYQMGNQPIGKIVTLLLKEHDTKKDYINAKRKHPIDPFGYVEE